MGGLALAAALVLGQQQVPIEPVALDHRDQWGVNAALGASFITVIRAGDDAGGTFVPTLQVGVSRAISELSELHVNAELFDDARLRPWIFGGYRGYSTEGPLTTAFDLDLAVATGQDWGVGAHGAVGLQWDPVRSFGLFLSLGFSATIGASLDLAFDGLAGAQARF